MVDIKTVGVIGAGQMGSGIAHVCALGGYDVRLHDVSRERIDAGVALIGKNLARQVARNIIDQDAADAACLPVGIDGQHPQHPGLALERLQPDAGEGLAAGFVAQGQYDCAGLGGGSGRTRCRSSSDCGCVF